MDPLSHPLVVTIVGSLVAFSLLEIAAIISLLWRVSSSIQVQAQTDKHVLNMLAGHETRLRRLEDFQMGGNDGGTRERVD